MSDPDANSLEEFLNELYEATGLCLDLAETSIDSEEAAYWLGNVDAYVDTISLITGQTFDEALTEIEDAFAEMSMAERVDEVFNEHNG